MKALCAISIVAWLGVLTLRGSARPEAPYQVIVHPSNPITRIDKSHLASIFLKKRTVWPRGKVIQPVDQPRGAPVRRHFTRDVLRRSVSAVRNYWRQAIYSGRNIPPPELPGDEAVVQFVRRNQGAIGYISAPADPQGVKVVMVQ